MRTSECAPTPPRQRKRAKLVIRHIRKTDRTCTAQIDEDCFSSSAEDFKGSKEEKVVVAVQARTIVGYIRFSIEEDQIYLANVCTAEDARGEKICQKMVRWLTKKLSYYKRTKISLIAANETAARCYEKVGFKDDGGSYMTYTKPATARRRRRRTPTSTATRTRTRTRS